MSELQLDKFIGYWNSYASETEAKNTSKLKWDTSSIKKGVILAALQGVVASLKSDLNNEVLVEQIDEVFWISKTPLQLGLIRVKVLGINLENDLSSDTLSEVKESSRESLCLCIISERKNINWQSSISTPFPQSAGILSLFPADIDALALGRCNLKQLVEYKLYRRLVLDKSDYETQFDDRLFSDFNTAKKRNDYNQLRQFSDVLDEVEDDSGMWIDHPLKEKIVTALKAERNCLLSGNSSSGKTILTLQIGKQLLFSGRKVWHLNLRNIETFPSNAVETLMFGEEDIFPDVIILDDLQSSPTAAKYLLTVASIIKRTSIVRPPSTLAVTWRDFADEALKFLEDCLPLTVDSNQIRNAIVNRYGIGISSTDKETLLKSFGENILLLREALTKTKSDGGIPSQNELAESLWKSRLSNFTGSIESAKKIALIVGTLGRYDISTPLPFLLQQAKVEKQEINNAEECGLLRKTKDLLTLGHRTFCVLITDWLLEQNTWLLIKTKYSQSTPISVVLDYLRSLDSGNALDTLRFLNSSIGVKKGNQLNNRAAVIVEIWEAFNSLVERIERQQIADPTWGNTPSSAMFATQTFSELGKAQLAEPSIEFLRQFCSIENKKLIINIEGLSTIKDFEQIIDRMLEEDTLIEASGLQNLLTPATEIDLIRFHKTWLSGVYLCAEAAFNTSPTELQKIVEAVESEQLESGAFYPERVPWVTSRVLLGLAACGRLLDNSKSVKNAVGWLLKSRKEGGARTSILWESGTGTWNSRLETTAMTLLVLASVGHDCEEQSIAEARNYLFAQRSEWVAPGKELDGALSLQAFLDTGGSWENVIREAQHLSRWAIGEAFWGSATISSEESLQQSCRVAQIAAHLIEIGWSAVRTDIPDFLDALEMPDLKMAPGFFNGVKEVKPKKELLILDTSLTETDIIENDENLKCLRQISSISLPKLTVIGNYRRYDEKARNSLRQWANSIKESLKSNIKARQNFLIWAPPGSGKTFLIQEIARVEEVEFIELNLARDSKENFTAKLSALKFRSNPTLCLLDEIDAKAEDAWFYETIFPNLDLNLEDSPNIPIVFVLIGSSGVGLEVLKRNITQRIKGKDLLDRVPENNRFVIPEMAITDKVVITISQLTEFIQKKGLTLKEVDKLALYYVLANEELQSPRQLREFAVNVVERLPANTEQVMYDELFARGDRRQEEFWAKYIEIAHEFANSYISVEYQ